MKKKLYIGFLFILVIFSSCRERMEVETGTTYIRLYVNAKLTNDTMAHRVQLLKTADYFSNKPAEPVKNAVIFITNGTDTFNLKESTNKAGEYFTDSTVYGIPGRTYHLIIRNVDIGNGVSEYRASCLMPQISKIDSVIIKKAEENWGPSKRKEYEVQLFAQDPVETKDFYVFKMSRNGVSLTDTISRLTSSNDDLFNGSYTNGIGLYHIIDEYEKRGQGNLYVKGGYNPEDQYLVEVDRVTEDYYNYITQSQLNYMGTNPLFGGAPANVVTNIIPIDNAVGFFAAYAADRKLAVYRK